MGCLWIHKFVGAHVVIEVNTQSYLQVDGPVVTAENLLCTAVLLELRHRVQIIRLKQNTVCVARTLVFLVHIVAICVGVSLVSRFKVDRHLLVFRVTAFHLL